MIMRHGEQRGGRNDDKLTVGELGQLTRDLVMGRPPSVVLDTPIKVTTFLSLRADIERAKRRGHTIETPE